MKVLCILARKRESTPIFRLIKIIDPDAFVSQSAVIGVYGEGFDHVKIKVQKKDKEKLYSSSLLRNDEKEEKEEYEDSIRNQQREQVTGNP